MQKPLPKHQTNTDHLRRIESVVDLIKANPECSFSVSELADHAAYSEFHFHRVFRAVSGETVAKCIARLRLEKAASALVYRPNRPITEIALECGFSSSANFSKAFRKAFSLSPTQYRKSHPSGFRNSRIGKAITTEPVYAFDMSKDVEIVNTPDRTLACLRQIGPYSHEGISRLYVELSDWFQTAMGHLPPEESINITWSDSALADQETWRMDACYEVPDQTKGSGPIAVRNLSGGRTACLRVPLQISEMHRISDCWDWMFSTWLPGTGAEPADRPAYETYREMDDKSGFNIMLCLPLNYETAEHYDE